VARQTVCAPDPFAGLNREPSDRFFSTRIGTNDLFFLVLWQPLDTPFHLEGETSAPEPLLEDKLQGRSAAQIPSASAAI